MSAENVSKRIIFPQQMGRLLTITNMYTYIPSQSIAGKQDKTKSSKANEDNRYPPSMDHDP
jgi:hypothetical protein